MHTGYDDGIRLFVDGKTAMSFHGTWASGLLMKGKGFKTGIFTPPWNAAGEKVVPVIGSETGFAVCETPNKKAAFLFFDYLYGKGFQIQQNKRQNISPLKKMQGQEVGDQQVIDYVNVISHAPVTGSPYYAFLPASTIEMLHPLLQNVLFGNVSPQQAAKMLDASVKNEARRKL